jgi:hypothetical protein
MRRSIIIGFGTLPGSGDDLYLVPVSWLRSAGLGGCRGGLKGFFLTTLMFV